MKKTLTILLGIAATTTFAGAFAANITLYNFFPFNSLTFTSPSNPAGTSVDPNTSKIVKGSPNDTYTITGGYNSPMCQISKVKGDRAVIACPGPTSGSVSCGSLGSNGLPVCP